MDPQTLQVVQRDVDSVVISMGVSIYQRTNEIEQLYPRVRNRSMYERRCANIEDICKDNGYCR